VPKSARFYNHGQGKEENYYKNLSPHQLMMQNKGSYASPISNADNFTGTGPKGLRNSQSPMTKSSNPFSNLKQINSTIGILKASFGSRSRSKSGNSRHPIKSYAKNEMGVGLTSTLKSIHSTMKLDGRILANEYSALTRKDLLLMGSGSAHYDESLVKKYSNLKKKSGG